MKIGKKTSRFVLVVIPGDVRVDTGKIKSLFSGATYAGFAATDVAERLAGSEADGTVLPFTFHPELTLIADPSVAHDQELFFNAARLDRSVALRTSDYLAMTKPRLERIAWLEPAREQHLARVRFWVAHLSEGMAGYPGLRCLRASRGSI